MDKLKPCPFCGGEAKINARQSGFHGENFEGNKKISWTIYIKCNKCHSRGKPIKTEPFKLWDGIPHIETGSFYSTEYWCGSGRGLMTATLKFEPYVKKAIEAWNRRAEENRPEKKESTTTQNTVKKCEYCIHFPLCINENLVLDPIHGGFPCDYFKEG